MIRRRMTQEDIEWLLEGGFLERTADGKLRLTEEGAYIIGRLEPASEGGKSTDTEGAQ